MSVDRSSRLWAPYEAEKPTRKFAETLVDWTKDGTASVLDIGCGFDTRTLARLHGPRVGVDLVQTFSPAPGVHVARATGECLPFAAETFDLVCCRSVLEHVEDPDVLFAEVNRVLRPGGVFFVLTPNRWDYVSLFATAVPNILHPRVVRFVTGRAEERTFPTLYRANTKGALTALARRSGLAVEDLRLCRQAPHYLKKTWVLFLAGVIFEQCVQRPIPVLRPWLMGSFRKPGTPRSGKWVGRSTTGTLEYVDATGDR